MSLDRRHSTSKTVIGPKKRIGLVLSGGGTKAGAFHLGVALALQEQGFTFRGGLKPKDKEAQPPGPMEISAYVGSSAGSLVSASLTAGYSLETILESFVYKRHSKQKPLKGETLPRLTYQKMFKLRPELAKEQFKQLSLIRDLASSAMDGSWEKLLLFKLIKFSGLFSIAGMEQFMREEVLLSNSFHDHLADLFIVGTHLNNSQKAVFGKYRYAPPPHDPTCQYVNDISISDACSASAALPFVYAPHPITFPDGKVHYFIDGEIRETLSSHVAIDAGCDLVIASHTHQPYHFTPELGSLTELGLPAIIIQSIYLLIEQKINHHRHNKRIQRRAIDAVDQLCKTEGLSDSLRKKIVETLEKELHHRRDVDVIYIHPKPNDTRMFVREHFTLSPNKMSDIVRSGFRAGIEILRQYDFADRKAKPAPMRAVN